MAKLLCHLVVSWKDAHNPPGFDRSYPRTYGDHFTRLVVHGSYAYPPLTDGAPQEAYGSYGVPVDTPPRVAGRSYHDSSEDPGGGEMASKLSRLAFTYNHFACIFSLIDLTRKARKALHRNTGSSKQCQALLAELDSFSQLLHSVQDALASRQDSPNPVPGSVVKAIQHALNSSRVTLGELYASIESYHICFGKGGVCSIIWEPWRKLEWALLKGKITEIRRKLQDDVERIDALMFASQWYAFTLRHSTTHGISVER